MIKWKVDGLDRDTAEPRTIWVESASRESAIDLAGNHNMVVSGASQDQPVFKVVSQLPSGTMTVELTKRQLKSMMVTQWDIGVGVFVGLLLWSIACALIVVLLWGLVVAAIISAAGGVK